MIVRHVQWVDTASSTITRVITTVPSDAVFLGLEYRVPLGSTEEYPMPKSTGGAGIKDWAFVFQVVATELKPPHWVGMEHPGYLAQMEGVVYFDEYNPTGGVVSLGIQIPEESKGVLWVRSVAAVLNGGVWTPGWLSLRLYFE